MTKERINQVIDRCLPNLGWDQAKISVADCSEINLGRDDVALQFLNKIEKKSNGDCHESKF